MQKCECVFLWSPSFVWPSALIFFLFFDCPKGRLSTVDGCFLCCEHCPANCPKTSAVWDCLLVGLKRMKINVKVGCVYRSSVVIRKMQFAYFERFEINGQRDRDRTGYLLNLSLGRFWDRRMCRYVYLPVVNSKSKTNDTVLLKLVFIKHTSFLSLRLYSAYKKSVSRWKIAVNIIISYSLSRLLRSARVRK